jgi:chaperonin GroES
MTVITSTSRTPLLLATVTFVLCMCGSHQIDGFVLNNKIRSPASPSHGVLLFADVTAVAPETSSTSSTGYSLDGEEIRGPITPLRNFILVKVKDTLTATEGGILLPDQSKERPTEGLVVAAGPGKIHPFTAKRIDNPIKPGMSVLYGKYDGKAIEYNEDQCQMIRDDDCLLAYEGVTMKLDNVFPVRDYVLIALDENPETLATSSGVVIANQVVKDDVPCEGVVVKVGQGRMASTGELTKCPVKVGETVKFKDYAGNDVTIEGKPYSVVKMVDILSSLNEDRVKELKGGDDDAP